MVIFFSELQSIKVPTPITESEIVTLFKELRKFFMARYMNLIFLDKHLQQIENTYMFPRH